MPAPFFVGVGVFAFEGEGEVDGAVAGVEIGLVNGLDAAEVIV